MSLKVPCSNLQNPIQVTALDNHIIHPCTKKTMPVSLSIDNHRKYLIFHIINSPQLPLVLGATWLTYTIHTLIGILARYWVGGELFNHLSPCCLFSAHRCPVKQEDEYPDLPGVPAKYLYLKKVLSKTKATSVPHHRPYDCGIVLTYSQE